MRSRLGIFLAKIASRVIFPPLTVLLDLALLVSPVVTRFRMRPPLASTAILDAIRTRKGKPFVLSARPANSRWPQVKAAVLTVQPESIKLVLISKVIVPLVNLGESSPRLVNLPVLLAMRAPLPTQNSSSVCNANLVQLHLYLGSSLVQYALLNLTPLQTVSFASARLACMATFQKITPSPIHTTSFVPHAQVEQLACIALCGVLTFLHSLVTGIQLPMLCTLNLVYSSNIVLVR